MMNAEHATRIVLADAQFLIRAGLRSLLSARSEFAIVGEAADMAELVTVCRETAPDLVVLDYAQPGAFRPDDLSMFHEAFPDIKLMIVSAESRREHLFAAVGCGVTAILTKTCDEGEILSALRAAAKREKFFCSKVLDILLEKHFPGTDSCAATELSSRESEIVRLVAEGYSSKDIAKMLYLSPHTVHTHRKNILRKLSIGSTSELVLYAVNTGLVKLEGKTTNS
jgi:DNA-binding NarL/FixJ family response regulator